MKKSIFISTAVLVGSLVFAQQKKEKPYPPPPPPILDAKDIAPPPPPAPKGPPKVLVDHFPAPNDENYKAFLRNNPSVKSVSWSENKIRIHLQSGKEEVFDLNNKEQMEKFKQQYGELPIPPPPPPPPPARPVAPKTDILKIRE